MIKNKLMVFAFFLGSLISSIGNIQAQFTDCDIIINGSGNKLVLQAGKTHCVIDTTPLEYNDIQWADGATLCIAPGAQLFIRNNMSNNQHTNTVNFEIYGELKFGNPSFDITVNMNIYRGGKFTTSGNATFRAPNVHINNRGDVEVSVLTFDRNSGDGNSGIIDIFNSEGATFKTLNNLNVANNVTLKFDNRGMLNVGAQFGLSPTSSYSNCGEIITKGFNLQKGMIYNTGIIRIDDKLEGEGIVNNYGEMTMDIISGSGKVFTNHGRIKVLKNSVADMTIYGPEELPFYGEFSWAGKAGDLNNVIVFGNQLFRNLSGNSSLSDMMQNESALKPQKGARISWYPCADCIVVVNEGCTPEKNYWMGGSPTKETDWDEPGNWTAGKVPVPGEDIEFATETNNNKKPAKDDLHLDTDRIIGDLINASDKDLVIPEGGNQLIIEGIVNDDPNMDGTIVIKASPTDPAGSLIFKDPDNNQKVKATVEFYNKAYDCATCGFYSRSWQYFGIPVQSSVFPYEHVVGNETVNRWNEPTNGNKWLLVPPATPLGAFKGYEMTNDVKIPPTDNYRYSGILNVGDASVSLTNTPSANYAGMNLVGNSYTAAIPITSDAIQFTGTQTVYLFNTGTRDQWRKLGTGTSLTTSDIKSGGYTAVPLNTAGTAGLPQVIPSMHAFMVSATRTDNLILKYDQLTKNELVADGVSTRSAEDVKEELPYVVMDVIGDESADRVWLFENILTTRSFDNGWDGRKIIEKGLVQVYVNGEDDKYQVATVPELEGADIGLTPDNENDYTLYLSVLPEVEARGLYLYDRLSKRTYPIRNNTEYVIAGGKPATAKRFTIVSDITNLDDALGMNSIDIQVVENSIRITNSSDENCTAVLYDLTGRLLEQRSVGSSSTEYIRNNKGWQTGVYIVRVYGTGKVNTTKRVIIK